VTVSSRRSSTSSTLLEPVASSRFRSLASRDALRMVMVMVGEVSQQNRQGIGRWNQTSREGSEKLRVLWGSIRNCNGKMETE